MKKLDLTPITNTTFFPVKSGTLQFVQDAPAEAIKSLLTNIINNPQLTSVYVLSGCVNTGTAPVYNISAGVVFYNGEIFDVPAASFTLTGQQLAYPRIQITQYTDNADPVEFTDAISRNVHNIRRIVIENTLTDSGIPVFTDFIRLKNIQSDLAIINSSITNFGILLNQIQNTLYANLPVVKGTASGINVGETSGTKTVTGGITSFVYDSHEVGGLSTTYLVTIPSMGDTNYYVATQVQSEGTIGTDNDVSGIVFKIVSDTQFRLSLQVTVDSIQNLKLHIQVYKS